MQRDQFDLVFSGEDPLQEYAHDCPVRYEVWLAYASDEEHTVGVAHDVMLRTHEAATSERVARNLVRSAGSPNRRLPRLALLGDYVAVSLSFTDLVRQVLPLTSLSPLLAGLRIALAHNDLLTHIIEGANIASVDSLAGGHLFNGPGRRRASGAFDYLSWFGRLLVATHLGTYTTTSSQAREALKTLLRNDEQRTENGPAVFLDTITSEPTDVMVDTVTLNRRAHKGVVESRKTVKADAAAALFGLSCASLTWAVLDSGVDALHPAFAARTSSGELAGQSDKSGPVAEISGGPTISNVRSRVTATYDFTRIRDILTTGTPPAPPDWERLEPQLRIPNDDYVRPVSDHGTHVAGVLGADWPEENVRGVCPDIRIWDLRVLDSQGEGRIRHPRRTPVPAMGQRPQFADDGRRGKSEPVATARSG